MLMLRDLYSESRCDMLRFSLRFTSYAVYAVYVVDEIICSRDSVILLQVVVVDFEDSTTTWNIPFATMLSTIYAMLCYALP